MTREDPQMKLRLPEDMRDRIAETAKKHGRSMNAEIVARLEESLAASGNPNMVAALARLAVALAYKDAAKITEQVRATMFAGYVRQFGRLLLPLVEEDLHLVQEIRLAISEADTVFHSRPKLENEAANSAAAMQQAMRLMERLAGMTESDPQLNELLETVQQLADTSKS